jgi:hypothetical protein
MSFVGRTAFERGDLADTLLFHLVDPQDGVQRQVGSLHPVELPLDAFLGRVHHDRGTLAENELLHLNETEQLAMADTARVDLVNLALIHEHNAENVTDCHGLAWGSLLI